MVHCQVLYADRIDLSGPPGARILCGPPVVRVKPRRNRHGIGATPANCGSGDYLRLTVRHSSDDSAVVIASAIGSARARNVTDEEPARVRSIVGLIQDDEMPDRRSLIHGDLRCPLGVATCPMGSVAASRLDCRASIIIVNGIN